MKDMHNLISEKMRTFTRFQFSSVSRGGVVDKTICGCFANITLHPDIVGDKQKAITIKSFMTKTDTQCV